MLFVYLHWCLVFVLLFGFGDGDFGCFCFILRFIDFACCLQLLMKFVCL